MTTVRTRRDWLTGLWIQLPVPGLSDCGDVDRGARWSFIVRIDASGRVALPVLARAGFDWRGSVRVQSRGDAVVLRVGGGGRRVAVGERGRVVVPCWLRDAAGPDARLLVAVGADRAGEPVVLLAPPVLLCGFADAMVGER